TGRDLDRRDRLQVERRPGVAQVVEAARHPPDRRRLGVELVGVLAGQRGVAGRPERPSALGREVELIQRGLRCEGLAGVFLQRREAWAPGAPARLVEVMNDRAMVVE